MTSMSCKRQERDNLGRLENIWRDFASPAQPGRAETTVPRVSIIPAVEQRWRTRDAQRSTYHSPLMSRNRQTCHMFVATEHQYTCYVLLAYSTEVWDSAKCQLYAESWPGK
eukprot:scaffold5886_cov93-Cylindrotheca_fusiformis.AAC.4